MSLFKSAYLEHEIKRWMRPDAHRFLQQPLLGKPLSRFPVFPHPKVGIANYFSGKIHSSVIW